MNTRIDLYRKNWITGTSVSTIGWAAWQGKSYSGEAFQTLILSRIENKNIDGKFLNELARKLNGNYAIIIQEQNVVYLIADHIRSYPLLYYWQNDTLHITDHILASLKDNGIKEVVDICKSEVFLVAGLTLEDHTVFKNVRAIQAAEIVCIHPQEIIKERYFIYSLNTDIAIKLCISDEVKKQNYIFTHIFQRMLESAPTVHNWIIPLSGGHDSRMVINQMNKLGIKNILCYSYGKKENTQSQISKEIATKLGYPWYFIEYTPAKWEELRKGTDFNGYFDFAFNGISDPHIQDLLAVSELKKQGIIENGDIFVPGHTFDFLTGAYCIDGVKNVQSERDIYHYLSSYFNQWEYKNRSKNIAQEVTDMIKRAPVKKNVFPEYFHWQERHAKFIQNSVRVYEYFGFEWRTPLWDRELVDYWQKIPLDYKMYRNFLYSCEKNGLYEEPLLSIPFDLEMCPAGGLKEKFVSYLPLSWKRKLKYFLRKKVIHSDDGLFTVYATGSSSIKDILSYDEFPGELRRYLKPYLGRPLYWFPDNDNNTIYAIRDLFPPDKI